MKHNKTLFNLICLATLAAIVAVIATGCSGQVAVDSKPVAASELEKQLETLQRDNIDLAAKVGVLTSLLAEERIRTEKERAALNADIITALRSHKEAIEKLQAATPKPTAPASTTPDQPKEN